MDAGRYYTGVANGDEIPTRDEVHGQIMRRTPAIRPLHRVLHAPALMVLMIAPLAASADDFTLSLTDDSARGYFRFSEPSDELAAGAGYTYHTGSRHIGNVDVHAQGRTAINNFPMTVGLGLRSAYFRDSPVEGGAVAPGGYVRANIPEAPGLSFNTELYISPSILSFGDSDSMRHFEASLSYRLIRNAEVLVGYRYVGSDIEEANDDFRLEEGLIGGMRLLF